jgi:aminoglycoside/choline kinase family phosphotransferase
MVLEDDKNLGIIDFQDAVVGAYTYDLVSILRDAYVSWPTQKVKQWMAEFWQQLPSGQTEQKTFADFEREFDFMAAQRHLKVLGIFIRLNVRDGKTGYMKDIPLVFAYLLQELKAYPELQAFSQLLLNKIQPAFAQQFPESQHLMAELSA